MGTAGASVNDTAQGARLPRQMEGQVHVVQVLKGGVGHPPDGVLGDLRPADHSTCSSRTTPHALDIHVLQPGFRRDPCHPMCKCHICVNLNRAAGMFGGCLLDSEEATEHGASSSMLATLVSAKGWLIWLNQ